MRISTLFASLCVLSALIALPAAANANCGCHSKCGSKCGSYHATSKCGTGYRASGNDNYAVAGYNDEMRDDYMAMQGGSGYSRSMASVDAARIAEYHNIFGGPGYAVAGYSGTWQPWTSGGTWVTVNGQRTWAMRNDFMWMNNRWVWNDDNTASVMFEDPRFNVSSHDWTATWSPWNGGGTWVNVNGQRMWATQDDFVWAGEHWTWADDDTATVSFDDNRFNIDAQDWGVDDINHDRFDLDVDRDKLDLDTDTFKVPDKLEIK